MVKYKRPRRSMYDEYREEIAECISQGMYTKEIAERISRHFGYEVLVSSLYKYIKNNTDMKINEINVPKCEQCDKCSLVKDFSGNNDYRLCESSRRIVSRTVHTSPSWCKKRGAVIES